MSARRALCRVPSQSAVDVRSCGQSIILPDGGVHVRIVVPRETAPGERRVALVPESCKKLIQAGYEISIEAGAAEAAGFSNQQYVDAGVAVVADAATLVGAGDLVLKVTAPTAAETALMKPGAIYVGSLMPMR